MTSLGTGGEGEEIGEVMRSVSGVGMKDEIWLKGWSGVFGRGGLNGTKRCYKGSIENGRS